MSKQNDGSLFHNSRFQNIQNYSNGFTVIHFNLYPKLRTLFRFFNPSQSVSIRICSPPYPTHYHQLVMTRPFLILFKFIHDKSNLKLLSLLQGCYRKSYRITLIPHKALKSVTVTHKRYCICFLVHACFSSARTESRTESRSMDQNSN